ncbi:MAG: hypothetical protein RR807_07975, partial [Oscillospiraceae bacterium]
MTTKLKKLLTSLLAFSLVLGMLPMGTMASAAANISGENITVWQYHVPYSNVSALEDYAKAQTSESTEGMSLYEIHVMFQNKTSISLLRILEAWSAPVKWVGQQPKNVASIELGYLEDLGTETKFLTIAADKLNFANFENGINYSEISLSNSAENFTLSFQYVVPAGFDNVQPAPENIKLPTEVTQNTPFAFGTPPYGTTTIPEFYEFHGWYS